MYYNVYRAEREASRSQNHAPLLLPHARCFNKRRAKLVGVLFYLFPLTVWPPKRSGGFCSSSRTVLSGKSAIT
jgi:hypothetical protein